MLGWVFKTQNKHAASEDRAISELLITFVSITVIGSPWQIVNWHFKKEIKDPQWQPTYLSFKKALWSVQHCEMCAVHVVWVHRPFEICSTLIWEFRRKKEGHIWTIAVFSCNTIILSICNGYCGLRWNRGTISCLQEDVNSASQLLSEGTFHPAS